MRRAALAVVSVTVLFGLLLGAMTMHQHHAAHHGAVQPVATPSAAHAGHGMGAHASLAHMAFSGHHAPEAVVSQPQQEPFAAVSSNDAVSGDGSTNSPSQIALKLCLAVLLGIGGFVALRIALAAQGFNQSAAAAFRLVTAAAAGLRARSSGPPGRTSIARLCVLRQ